MAHDQLRQATSRLASVAAATSAAGVAMTALVAPLVPDEPAHLSGLALLLGLLLAGSAVIAGSLASHRDRHSRARARLSAAVGLLTILGVTAYGLFHVYVFEF